MHTGNTQRAYSSIYDSHKYIPCQGFSKRSLKGFRKDNATSYSEGVQAGTIPQHCNIKIVLNGKFDVLDIEPRAVKAGLLDRWNSQYCVNLKPNVITAKGGYHLYVEPSNGLRSFTVSEGGVVSWEYHTAGACINIPNTDGTGGYKLQHETIQKIKDTPLYKELIDTPAHRAPPKKRAKHKRCKPVPVAQVKEMLACIPSKDADNDTVYKVCAGVYSNKPTRQQAQTIITDWLGKHRKKKAAEVPATLQSIAEHGSDVTMGTVIELARQHGYKTPSDTAAEAMQQREKTTGLPFHEQYRICWNTPESLHGRDTDNKKSLVFNTSTGDLCSSANFNDKFALLFKDNEAKKADKYLIHSGVPPLEGFGYRPDKSGSLVYSENGTPYANIYRGWLTAPKPVKPNEKQQRLLDMFIWHCRTGYDLNGEDDFIINWCTFVVQNPGVKSEIMPHLTGIPRTGKTLIGRLLMKALGGVQGGCCTTISSSTLASNFTGHWENSIFAMLDEVQSVKGLTRADVRETLKAVITDDYVDYHHKRRTPYAGRSFLNLMATSNRADTFTHEEQEDRIIHCPIQYKEEEEQAAAIRNAWNISKYAFFKRLATELTPETLRWFFEQDRGVTRKSLIDSSRVVNDSRARRDLVAIAGAGRYGYYEVSECLEGIQSDLNLQGEPNYIRIPALQQWYFQNHSKDISSQLLAVGLKLFKYELTPKRFGDTTKKIWVKIGAPRITNYNQLITKQIVIDGVAPPTISVTLPDEEPDPTPPGGGGEPVPAYTHPPRKDEAPEPAQVATQSPTPAPAQVPAKVAAPTPAPAQVAAKVAAPTPAPAQVATPALTQLHPPAPAQVAAPVPAQVHTPSPVQETATTIIKVESYPNVFLAGFTSAEDTYVAFVMKAGDGFNSKALEYIKNALSQPNVGYGSMWYDIPLLVQAMQDGETAQSLHKRSQELKFKINRAQAWQVLPPEVKRHHTDMYPLYDMDIDALAVKRGYDNIAPLPFKKDAELCGGQWGLLKDADIYTLGRYNMRFLWEIAALYSQQETQQKLQVREELEQEGIDAITCTEPRIADNYAKMHGVNNSSAYPDTFKGLPLGDFHLPKDNELSLFFKKLITGDYTKDNNGVYVCMSGDQVIDKYEHTILGTTITIRGDGGLHSKNKYRHVRAGGGYSLYNIDVASYYPTLLVKMEIQPPRLKPKFARAFNDIIARRMEAKQAGNKTVSDALKIILNSTYGKMGSPYSPLYYPAGRRAICVAGQMYLTLLLESIESDVQDVDLLDANTDGVLIRVPEHTVEALRGVVNDWEKSYGFQTDTTEVMRFIAKDCNNYYIENSDGSVKRTGVFAPAGKRNTLNGEAIYNAVIASVKEGRMPVLDDFPRDDTTPYIFSTKTPSVLRFYWSKTGRTLKHDDGSAVPKGKDSRLAMVLSNVEMSDIDIERYHAEACKIVEKFAEGGDLEITSTLKETIPLY